MQFIGCIRTVASGTGKSVKVASRIAGTSVKPVMRGNNIIEFHILIYRTQHIVNRRIDIDFSVRSGPFNLSFICIRNGRNCYFIDLHLIQNISIPCLISGSTKGHNSIFPSAQICFSGRMGNGGFQIDRTPFFSTGNGTEFPQREHRFLCNKCSGNRTQSRICCCFLIFTGSTGKSKSKVLFPQCSLQSRPGSGKFICGTGIYRYFVIRICPGDRTGGNGIKRQPVFRIMVDSGVFRCGGSVKILLYFDCHMSVSTASGICLHFEGLADFGKVSVPHYGRSGGISIFQINFFNDKSGILQFQIIFMFCCLSCGTCKTAFRKSRT